MKFSVIVKRYPECRLRKVVGFITVPGKGYTIDGFRMFAGPFFEQRLKRKIARALRRAEIMLSVSMEPLP